MGPRPLLQSNLIYSDCAAHINPSLTNSECITNSNCNFSLNSFVSGLGTIVPHRLAIASDNVHDYLLDDEEFDEELGSGQLDDGVAASIIFT